MMSDSSSMDNKPCHFLRVPLEIRERIYYHIFVGIRSRKWRDSKEPITRLNILLTTSAIHDEAWRFLRQYYRYSLAWPSQSVLPQRFYDADPPDLNLSHARRFQNVHLSLLVEAHQWRQKHYRFHGIPDTINEVLSDTVRSLCKDRDVKGNTLTLLFDFPYCEVPTRFIEQTVKDIQDKIQWRTLIVTLHAWKVTLRRLDFIDDETLAACEPESTRACEGALEAVRCPLSGKFGNPVVKSYREKETMYGESLKFQVPR